MSKSFVMPGRGAHISERADIRDTRPSEAIEDYAKALYSLGRKTGGGPVGTNDLAERLGVSPASATAMLKRMAERGLVEHTPYRGATLTPEGEKVALVVVRNHRLLETYLSEVLDMPWDRVHDEAEVLEHHISDELAARIAASLGDPSHDPHGDPIPSEDLEIDEQAGMALADAEAGVEHRFVRVSDADPEMLRHLATEGIRPGATVTVVEVEPFGGSVRVRVDGRDHSLGSGLASRMRVVPVAS